MERLPVDMFSTLARLCIAPMSQALGCTRCRHPSKVIIRRKKKKTNNAKILPSSITTP